MNNQKSLYTGNEQWLINLNECRVRKDMSLKYIAEKTDVSEKSVHRIFTGESKSPGVEIVRRIIRVMDSSINEIFGESGAVIGGQDLVALQAQVDSLTAENSLLRAENSTLKDKSCALTSENELLRLKLEHKEEIISLHNYYNKLKSGN